jgi:hypothetical protein
MYEATGASTSSCAWRRTLRTLIPTARQHLPIPLERGGYVPLASCATRILDGYNQVP